jgi:Tat protein secretion system quality control protein TatD with DNase activity
MFWLQQGKSRFKFSVPGHVYLVANEVAKIKKLTVDEVLLASRQNVEETYQ